MKTILFYWSKGSEIRRKIIRIIKRCEKENMPCYLNSISAELGLSHVAVKKHLDILIEEGYGKILNPAGKPQYLQLTEKGNDIFEELMKK